MVSRDTVANIITFEGTAAVLTGINLQKPEVIAEFETGPGCREMDRDHREDFTFAKLSDIKLPVTFRMCVCFGAWRRTFGTAHRRRSSQLEGIRKPRPFTELLENPDLRFHGVQS